MRVGEPAAPAWAPMNPGPWPIPSAARGELAPAGEPSVWCGTWVLQCLELRQSHPGLLLILTLLVGIARLTYVIIVGFEEEHLADAFVCINLGWQRSGVTDLQRYIAFPLRFERGDVGDDAAAGVCGFAQAYRQDVARDPEVLHRASQGKAVGRNDADVTVELDEAARIKVLRINDDGEDVGKNSELGRHAHIVPVGRDAVGNRTLAYLPVDEGLDHPVLTGHATDPGVGLDGHFSARQRGDTPLGVMDGGAGVLRGRLAAEYSRVEALYSTWEDCPLRPTKLTRRRV